MVLAERATRSTKSAFNPSVRKPFFAKMSLSSLTVSAALAAAAAAAALSRRGVVLFSPSVEGSSGSTETLLERRDERRLDSGAGG